MGKIVKILGDVIKLLRIHLGNNKCSWFNIICFGLFLRYQIINEQIRQSSKCIRHCVQAQGAPVRLLASSWIFFKSTSVNQHCSNLTFWPLVWPSFSYIVDDAI